MNCLQAQEKKAVTLGSLCRDKHTRGLILQIIAVIGVYHSSVTLAVK